MTTSTGHAIVFGASGLAGWGVVDQLLQNYPTKGTFSKVTAVVNRPISVAESLWPITDSPAFGLVTGINLAKGSVETFTALLKEKIHDISTVTHVYYFVYMQNNDPRLEIETNCGMLERVVGAIEPLCPNFRFLAWASGTLGYGISKPGGGPFKPPYKESMGRLPPPDTNFYYAFEDILTERSKGKNWTWCQVRPDAIVGFSPNGSTYSLPAHWATYLSLYRAVEGEGASVPYPGTEASYDTKFTDASSEMIAKLAIWASLHPDKAGGGQLFNIADRAEPSTMRERWPALAAFFGLVGVEPPAPGVIVLKPGEYALKHQDVLKAKCKKAKRRVWGGVFGWIRLSFHFGPPTELGQNQSHRVY
ncbi:Sirq protein [Mycena sanguinolenta]|uniref:Sirq protein n=1 Tax=Mycena sanguinolenta TaxID=230812 RepID=A0A8H7CXW0_9AGAR|nr:Sirq protein [Mycena sanguinolenta]